jgi:hypothetical protein
MGVHTCIGISVSAAVRCTAQTRNEEIASNGKKVRRI